MSLIFHSLIENVIAIIVTVFVGLVLYYKWAFTYWKRRNLEYLEPSIPLGNTVKLFTHKTSFGEQFADFYFQLKSKGLKHGGVYMFARPFYVPTDLEIVKNIIQKDFVNFVDRGFYTNDEIDPLSGNLFLAEGAKWKNLRNKLTATFTSGKMKMMFETMTKCTAGLDEIMQEASFNKTQVDIKDVLARFTTDVIGCCAFGLDINSLKNPKDQFRHYGRRIVEHTTLESIQQLIQFAFPRSILEKFKFKITKPDVEVFIKDVVKKTADYREENNIYRKDFFHLLLQLKNFGNLVEEEKVTNNNGSVTNGLTLNEISAQVFAFFLAGFETSSTTMTFALYELAKNQHIQRKLQEEIHRILQQHNGKITYEGIMEMTYMDKVIYESLRRYPPVPMLNRQCTKPYNIPGTNITLEKGTMVVIPIYGIQHDPEYYPEPEKFDPERFNEQNKNTRPATTWLPFGEGPRICIGLRFGMMQVKVGLTALLRNYTVTLNENTKPLRISRDSLILGPEDNIYLKVTKNKI